MLMLHFDWKTNSTERRNAAMSPYSPVTSWAVMPTGQTASPSMTVTQRVCWGSHLSPDSKFDWRCLTPDFFLSFNKEEGSAKLTAGELLIGASFTRTRPGRRPTSQTRAGDISPSSWVSLTSTRRAGTSIWCNFWWPFGDVWMGMPSLPYSSRKRCAVSSVTSKAWLPKVALLENSVGDVPNLLTSSEPCLHKSAPQWKTNI